MTTDLFGHLDETTGNVRPGQVGACAHCGLTFPVLKRNGRPHSYCGANCRRAAKQAMVTQFGRDHRGEVLTPGNCRICEKPIEIVRRPGRFPYFCSAMCKRLAQHPTLARGAPLLDLVARDDEIW